MMPSIAPDPETGKLVHVLVDPDGTLRYRAQDCKEGREFLAALREYQSKRLDERREDARNTTREA